MNERQYRKKPLFQQFTLSPGKRCQKVTLGKVMEQFNADLMFCMVETIHFDKNTFITK